MPIADDVQSTTKGYVSKANGVVVSLVILSHTKSVNATPEEGITASVYNFVKNEDACEARD